MVENSASSFFQHSVEPPSLMNGGRDGLVDLTRGIYLGKTHSKGVPRSIILLATVVVAVAIVYLVSRCSVRLGLKGGGSSRRLAEEGHNWPSLLDLCVSISSHTGSEGTEELSPPEDQEAAGPAEPSEEPSPPEDQGAAAPAEPSEEPSPPEDQGAAGPAGPYTPPSTSPRLPYDFPRISAMDGGDRAASSLGDCMKLIKYISTSGHDVGGGAAAAIFNAPFPASSVKVFLEASGGPRGWPTAQSRWELGQRLEDTVLAVVEGLQGPSSPSHAANVVTVKARFPDDSAASIILTVVGEKTGEGDEEVEHFV